MSDFNITALMSVNAAGFVGDAEQAFKLVRHAQFTNQILDS